MDARYLPRYALKSVKYFLQSEDSSWGAWWAGGGAGPLSMLYFRSSTGENETDLGDAERVRTDDAIPLLGYIRGVLCKLAVSRAVTARLMSRSGWMEWLFSLDDVRGCYRRRGRRRVIARSHWELATSRRAIPGRCSLPFSLVS